MQVTFSVHIKNVDNGFLNPQISTVYKELLSNLPVRVDIPQTIHAFPSFKIINDSASQASDGLVYVMRGKCLERQGL